MREVQVGENPRAPGTGFGGYRNPRRLSVRYDTGVTPVSSMTRSESALLVGSMINAYGY